MLARDALLEGELLVGEAALEAMRDHARSAFPNEAVGFVWADGSYQPQANVYEDSTKGARVDLAVLQAALTSGDLRAYFHSHPNGPDCPSEQDMRSQIELDVPWIICSATETATLPPFAFGDQLTNPAPLVGRPFRHGVTDCYAAVRAWGLQERGVLLPEYPRQWEWWLPKQEVVDEQVVQAIPPLDLYRQYFAEAGFRQIDFAEVRAGDCWLAQIRSKVPNHAGVYIGDGLAFHHATTRLAYDPARLSKREPITRWQQHITHWLRRDDWC